MKKFLKAIVLVVTVAFILSIFAVGCTKKDDNTNVATTTTQEQGQGQATAEEQKGPYDKHLEISWIGHNSPNMDVTDRTEFQMEIEQKFNVTIKPVNIDIFNDDLWSLFWAAGNTADYIQTNTAINFYKMADQKLIREMGEENLKKYAPAIWGSIQDLVPPEMINLVMSYKGKWYGIPYLSTSWPDIMGVRKDWMDNVGIAEFPKTVDEFHNMLQKFAKGDPNKSGKNDTYGIHGGAEGNINFYHYLFGAYGIQPNSYYLDDNNKVYYTNTSEAYKEVLKVISSWYKEGLIDPEFVTDSRDVQRQKWSEGKFGVLADNNWWFWGTVNGNVSTSVKEKNPNASVVPLPPFKGPDGHSGLREQSIKVPDNIICFGKDVTDEKLERILRIKDSFTSDINWWLRGYYGKEGEGYKIEDGVALPIGEYQTDENKNKKGTGPYYTLVPWTSEMDRVTSRKDDWAWTEFARAQEKSWSGVNFPTASVNELANEKDADITTIVNEFFLNAVTGKINIDEAWNKYIKNLESAGIKDIIAQYQKLYEAF